MTKFITTIASLLISITVFAQTPVVKTLTPTITQNCYTGSPSAGSLNGAIDPQGQSYTVYFEYGIDETFGNTTIKQTVATAQQVKGYIDDLIQTYNGDIFNQTIHHRLVAEDAQGNKYYGRDVPFHINHFYNPARVFIRAYFYNLVNKPLFEARNVLPIPLTIGYQNLEVGGSLKLGTSHELNQEKNFYCYKYSITSFYYNSVLFKQIASNNQNSYDPEYLVFAYPMGTINNGAGMVYLIINDNNTTAVPIKLLGAVNVADFTVPPHQQLKYVVTTNNDIEIDYNDNALMVVSRIPQKFGFSDLLNVKPLYSSSTTATFEIQNNNSSQHEFILKNTSGTEYTYTLAANSYQTVTLPKESYDVYVDFPFDINLEYPYVISNHYKFQSVSPITHSTPILPTLTSLTQNSLSSFTANGTITNNSTQAETVNYYFVYGTDPGNLNQSTATQQISIPMGQNRNVNELISGLTTDNLYYCRLVAGTAESNQNELLLIDLPKNKLAMHLRADLNITASNNDVSVWGDISGNDNDAVQPSLTQIQPLLVQNAIKDKPALRFNGLGEFMTLPTSTKLGIQSSPYEMFIVAKSSSGSIQFLIAGRNNEDFEYHLNGTAGSRFIPVGGQYVDQGINGEYTNGEAHIFSARASASGGVNRVDRTNGGTTANSLLSVNPNNLYLGTRNGGAHYFNGDIAEVIIYNKILTPKERDSVESYLHNRYFPKIISATVSPENSGVITGTGSYTDGQIVSLTANPNAGYSFVNWTENGNIVSSDVTYSFTINSSRALVANFALTTAIAGITSTSFINIYPNPVQNELTVELKDSKEHINLEIVNTQGQIVYQSKITGRTTIQMGDFTKGIYLLKFNNAEKLEVRKIIKE